MLRNSSKRRKRPYDFSFVVTVDRINQLELEFRQSEEFADLFRRESALEDKLMNAQTEQMKSVLVDFCDVNSEITEQKEKFFYKNAFIDHSTMTRLMMGRNRIKMAIRIM